MQLGLLCVDVNVKSRLVKSGTVLFPIVVATLSNLGTAILVVYLAVFLSPL